MRNYAGAMETHAATRDDHSLPALAIRFDMFCRFLNSLHLARDASPESQDGGSSSAGCEHILIHELHAASVQAASLEATNVTELCVKARIWLERWTPDDNDDIGDLAASICRDLLAIDGMNR
jgi:hypothetical protein